MYLHRKTRTLLNALYSQMQSLKGSNMVTDSRELVLLGYTASPQKSRNLTLEIVINIYRFLFLRMKPSCESIQMKAIEQYFSTAVFVFQCNSRMIFGSLSLIIDLTSDRVNLSRRHCQMAITTETARKEQKSYPLTAIYTA